MTINNKFELKQTVYLKTDTEQSPRIVTAMTIRDTSIIYELSCGTVTTWHIAYEISEDRVY